CCKNAGAPRRSSSDANGPEARLLDPTTDLSRPQENFDEDPHEREVREARREPSTDHRAPVSFASSANQLMETYFRKLRVATSLSPQAPAWRSSCQCVMACPPPRPRVRCRILRKAVKLSRWWKDTRTRRRATRAASLRIASRRPREPMWWKSLQMMTQSKD